MVIDSNTMGTVLVGQNLSARPMALVRKAVKDAGISEDLLYDIKPRSAFLRGMRTLAREGQITADLTDKALENSKTIRFAFVARLPGCAYAATLVVDYDKDANVVLVVNKPPTVTEKDVVAEAWRWIGSAREEATTSDLRSIVKRFCDSKCRRIALRDGVFFVPRQYHDVLVACRKFYKTLGFHYLTLPVGFNGEDIEAVQAAIVRDMQQQVADVRNKLKAAKQNQKGEVSKRAAQGQLSLLRKSLKQYRQLAEATCTKLKALVDNAGEAGEVLKEVCMTEDDVIKAIQSGRKFDPLSADLLVKSEIVKEVVNLPVVGLAVAEKHAPEQKEDVTPVQVDAGLPRL